MRRRIPTWRICIFLINFTWIRKTETSVPGPDQEPNVFLQSRWPIFCALQARLRLGIQGDLDSNVARLLGGDAERSVSQNQVIASLIQFRLSPVGLCLSGIEFVKNPYLVPLPLLHGAKLVPCGQGHVDWIALDDREVHLDFPV